MANLLFDKYKILVSTLMDQLKTTNKNEILPLLKQMFKAACTLHDEKVSIKFHQKTGHCDIIRKIAEGKVGIIKKVNCEGSSFIMKSTKTKQWFSIMESVSLQRQRGPNPQKVIKPVKFYVGSDEYTNETIIGLILNKISLNVSVRQDFAMVCGNHGYNIQETADYDLSDYIQSVKFNYSTFDRMIFSLIKSLSAMQKQFNYIHADLKAKNVLVFGDIAKIADYGKSSITYEGIRFYFAKYKTLRQPFNHLFAVPDVKDKTYVFNLSKMSAALNLRHRKRITYLNIDIYTLMISIALESNIFNNFILSKSHTTSFFCQLWEYLWVDNRTRDEVHKRIASIIKDPYQNPQSITTTFKVLKGLTLKYFLN
jgi:hypothetical protein